MVPLLVVAVIAAAVSYATWPYLHGDPIGHYLESLRWLAGDVNKD